MAHISLNDVHVSYGAFKALTGVSCELTGGAVGLLGPNGAGKSTLLRTLLGFQRAEKGQVSLFGLSMPLHAIDVRQRVGYMPERDVVSPRESAVGFLSHCGRLHGMNHVDALERAHEVLNYVGMTENRYRKMAAYSTGTCQRVKFAQALIHDPELLLLDEPTNNLDPKGRLEMLELIRELGAKRGISVILSTHLLPDVEYACDRVIMLSQGRIVRDGSISALTSLQEGEFEVGVHDNQTAFVAELEADEYICRNTETGVLLVGGPNGCSPHALFAAARANNTYIHHLRPVRRRLEDVFMDAMARN